MIIRTLFFIFLSFILAILVLPSLLVTMNSDSSLQQASAERQLTRDVIIPAKDKECQIPIYLTNQKRIEEIPLESYIRGVVAAEMPAKFHIEALKAQALTARTFIINRINKNDFTDMRRWGNRAKSAIVTDAIQHQVFLTDKDLRKKWGPLYSSNMKKLTYAVQSTQGKIITYKGSPIYAAFFSTSNGRTENSEDYFSFKYPYLRSVDSFWDKRSPEYERVQTWKMSELVKQIQRKTRKILHLPASSGHPFIHILKRTMGNRIERLEIGNRKFSGREIREVLNLPSTDFSIQIRKSQVKLITRGYGHGVGMSQWGANFMAQSGAKANAIIHHYYHGVKIDTIPQKYYGPKNNP